MRWQFALAVLALGCGEVDGAERNVVGPKYADASPSEKDSGHDAFAAPEASPSDRQRCPEEPPIPGEQCQSDLSWLGSCSYGDDPIPDCRPHFDCIEGTWQVSLDHGCQPLVESSCGGPPDDAGAPLECAVTVQEGDVCAYASGRLCVCQAGVGWQCATCDAIPNEGAPCWWQDFGWRCPPLSSVVGPCTRSGLDSICEGPEVRWGDWNGC